jgi:phosphonate transport system substrate-binding protein
MNQELRFATFLAPNMRPFYQFIADYVGRQLGLPSRLFTGHSFTQFAQGEADVGFICGLPYVRLVEERPLSVTLLAAPVLQGERFQNKPIYYSDVIVRRDSPYQSFADLRGCIWAYNEPDSQSGYNITLHHLANINETTAYFGEFVQAGAHQQAIRLICEGQVEAAAIDCQVLAVEMRQRPELAPQIKVIDALGPSPIQPVVAATHLPTSLQTEIQTVLLALADDPAAADALAYGFVQRFTAVADADYDDIRRMVTRIGSNLKESIEHAPTVV